MFSLLLGIILGWVGGWYVTRPSAPAPVAPPRPTMPPAEADTIERIVLPDYEPTQNALENGGAVDSIRLPAEAIETEPMPTSTALAQEAPVTASSVVATAYCVRCKARRPMQAAQRSSTANGRTALKGTCPVCGGGLFKLVKA